MKNSAFTNEINDSSRSPARRFDDGVGSRIRTHDPAAGRSTQ
jgi:hypothetical protein